MLPAVTTSQILPRRHLPRSLITSDGNFGPRTKAAMVAFQKFQTLAGDGTIGKNSWAGFTAVSRFQTIDVVDGTDPSLIQLEAAVPRAVGFDPIVVLGMSNGIDVVMELVRAKPGRGNVMLLRLHGHGNRGFQNVTGGEINGVPHLASIGSGNFGQIEPSLQKISGIFVPFGSVQMLGCDVGGGAGTPLMRRLADVWNVPVTAGLHTQFGGGARIFRFEGATVTGVPGGLSLGAWSHAMELAHGNESMPN